MRACYSIRRIALLAMLCVCVTPLWASSPPFPAADLQFFESKIRPLLADHCFECHGEEKQKGGLLLESRGGILQGGDTGPAIVPGKPEQSLMIEAVRYQNSDLQMPPKKKLSADQVGLLVDWIRRGAPWPAAAGPGESTSVKRTGAFHITEEDRRFWAFQPVLRPELPEVPGAGLGGHPIDRFIDARIHEKKLEANPLAPRARLIRRAYYDLIGLPPRYEEVEAFVADESADAYERMLDRLLAMPQYGERWGRHWLDTVRFAQSNGYERDDEKPEAWRYRDYVIRAFNSDKPYDRFVLEQIAGDELPDGDGDAVVATGFYRLGVWDDEPDDKRMAEHDGLDDVIRTTSETFMGLTIGCARCHDHMFDPVSQVNYYQLQAFFRNVRPYDKPKLELNSPTYHPVVSPRLIAGWHAEVRRREAALKAAGNDLEKQALETALASLRDNPPWEGKPYALSVREHGHEAPETFVLIRGNAGRRGAKVEPMFPAILTRAKPVFEAMPPDVGTTGRRLALARWIASPEHPLTARVMVNRIWQFHFGKGLVPTANDFGRAGVPPSHPRLLDWLAHEFVATGWSIKSLHKQIMLTKAYRRTSDQNEANLVADPDNRFLWRGNLRRLEAEAIRDAVLQVSGLLNPAMGGRGFFPRLSGEVIGGGSRPGRNWAWSVDSERHRRSVYTFIKRTMMVPFMEAFDYNNTEGSVGVRASTTVAPQALLLLNSRFMRHQSEALAKGVLAEAGDDSAQQIPLLFQRVLSRLPTERELQISREFLSAQTLQHAALTSRLLFRPEMCGALEQNFKNGLPAAEFLLGPGEGWDYFKGQWGGGYEGIVNVEPGREAFALLRDPSVMSFDLKGRLHVGAATETVAFLLRSQPRGDVHAGYEVHLDFGRGVMEWRRCEPDVHRLAEVELPLAREQWVSFRIRLEDARLRVWLGEGEAPLLDRFDSEPVTHPGRFGVRVWGGPLMLEDMQLQSPEHSLALHEVSSDPDTMAREQALRELCSLMFNLNEFIYVD